MSHSHNYEHSHAHEKQSLSNLWIAFWLNFTFVFIEAFAAYYSNSVAIFSDTIHDFGDSITIFFTILLSRYALKGRDDKFSFGYSRFNLVGALITNIILIVGCFFIVSQAIDRFQNPQHLDSAIMFWIAILGIVVNGIAVWRMMRTSNIMERTIWLHLIEDVLGWIAVLISSILIKYFNWVVLDSILSIAIAIFISYNVLKNLNEIFSIFLQKIPNEINNQEITKLLTAHPSIVDMHDLHIWSLDGHDIMLSCHLVFIDDILFSDAIKIKDQLKHQLEELGINHATIDIENEWASRQHGEIKN